MLYKSKKPTHFEQLQINAEKTFNSLFRTELRRIQQSQQHLLYISNSCPKIIPFHEALKPFTFTNIASKLQGHGLIMYGPTETGKSLLAYRLSLALNTPLFTTTYPQCMSQWYREELLLFFDLMSKNTLLKYQTFFTQLVTKHTLNTPLDPYYDHTTITWPRQVLIAINPDINISPAELPKCITDNYFFVQLFSNGDYQFQTIKNKTLIPITL